MITQCPILMPNDKKLDEKTVTCLCDGIMNSNECTERLCGRLCVIRRTFATSLNSHPVSMNEVLL